MTPTGKCKTVFTLYDPLYNRLHRVYALKIDKVQEQLHTFINELLLTVLTTGNNRFLCRRRRKHTKSEILRNNCCLSNQSECLYILCLYTMQGDCKTGATSSCKLKTHRLIPTRADI